jgi:hypothetical protein
MYHINPGMRGRETAHHLDLSTTITHHAHPLAVITHPHHQREVFPRTKWLGTRDPKTARPHALAHNDNAAAHTHPRDPAPALALVPQLAISTIAL